MRKQIIILFILFTACFCFAKEAEKPLDEFIHQSQKSRAEILVEDYKLPRQNGQDKTVPELQKLVNQLNALTFSSGSTEDGKPAKAVKFNSADSNDSDVNSIDINDVNAVSLKQKSTDGGTSEMIKADELLNNLKADPNKVVDKLRLADALYRDKKFKQSAIYYKLALTNYSDSKDDLGQSWILYQLGNCLKAYDYHKALEYYDKLISKYPESRWSDFALVQKQIYELIVAEQSIFKKIDKVENTSVKVADRGSSQNKF